MEMGRLMAKNSVEDFQALAAYGGKITEMDVKEKQFKLKVPVTRGQFVELNMFDAKLEFALEAFAKAAYEKGRYDQKVELIKEGAQIIKPISFC